MGKPAPALLHPERGITAEAANSWRAQASPGTEQIVLAASQLVKRWPRVAEPVVEDVTLQLNAGSAVRLRGKNGMGKTTLLRILAGLIAPDEGEVRVLGGLHPERDRRRYQQSVALMSAGDRGLYARLSVAHHLNLWARIAFLPRHSRAESVTRVVAQFGLDDLLARRVDRLSMGQRQRLRLAGLLLGRPAVLLLDEPGNSLDEDGLAILAGAVDDLVIRGGAVLWCSPSGEAAQYEFAASYELSGGGLKRDG